MSFLLSSCYDAFEENITEEYVELVAPSNQASVKEGLVHFSWNTDVDFRSYRFQLAANSFTSNANILADTIIQDSVLTQPTINFSLSSGSYEWRVIGYNDAYTSNAVIRSLQVEDITLENLKDTSIQIIQPSNGDQFLNPIVQFRWQTLPKVDLYEKQISQNVSFSSAEVNTTSSISDIDTLLENGVYYYRIRGFNSDNQIYTDWNIGSFTMNYPGVPAARLISPIASDTINLVFTPLLLQWSGSTAASIDSVFVCNNSSCNNPLRRYGLNVNSISINDFSQNEFTTDKQQLFWKVISYDAFGKPTESTSVNSFYIKRVQ